MYHRIGKTGNRYWGKRGAGIVFTDGESVLLLKRSEKGDNYGAWGLPGGKAEEEETFIGTAQRETKEEIGKLPNSSRIGSFEQIDGRHVFKIYICQINSQFDCKLSDEHSDFGWFKIDELNDIKLHDKLKISMPRIIKIIKSKIKNETIDRMNGFASFLSLMELAGATADLAAGYSKEHPDYQIEGDPSSMFPQKRWKKKKKK